MNKIKKDIFIDNNVAIKLSNPPEKEYKELIKWLLKENKETPDENAYIVISQKLLNEYHRSNQNAKSKSNITVILARMARGNNYIDDKNREIIGRKIQISKKLIKDFQNKNFSKKVLKKLQSNIEDREHIPVVMLSDRRKVLTEDINFTKDLKYFSAEVENKPKQEFYL